MIVCVHVALCIRVYIDPGHILAVSVFPYSMSLGTRTDDAINDAVNAAVDKGVNFAVSAGNDYGSACNKSPASALKW